MDWNQTIFLLFPVQRALHFHLDNDKFPLKRTEMQRFSVCSVPKALKMFYNIPEEVLVSLQQDLLYELRLQIKFTTPINI
mgnify:CR=1 FL=1